MVNKQMKGTIKTIKPVTLSIETLESGAKRIWADHSMNQILQRIPKPQKEASF